MGGCPGNGAIDVLASNNTEPFNPAGGVAYGSASNYMLVRSGNGLTTNVYAAGTTTNALAPQAPFTLSPHDPGTNNGTYTITASGVCGQPVGSAAAPQLARLIDNPPTPPANQALVRLVNLSPDAGNITLSNVSGNPPQTVPIVTTGVAYTQSSNYVAVTPIAGQSFNFSVSSGGQVLPIPAGSSTQTLQAGKAYTVFVFGEVNPANGGQLINMAVVQDAPITSPP